MRLKPAMTVFLSAVLPSPGQCRRSMDPWYYPCRNPPNKIKKANETVACATCFPLDDGYKAFILPNLVVGESSQATKNGDVVDVEPEVLINKIEKRFANTLPGTLLHRLFMEKPLPFGVLVVMWRFRTAMCIVM